MTIKKVFVSFSGDSGRAVAEKLKSLLEAVFHPSVEIWLSTQDIDPGGRWAAELASALENSTHGVIIITRESLNSTWVHFEAGAISRAINDPSGRVIPYLVGVKLFELRDPLAQFQAKQAESAPTRELVDSINDQLEAPLPSEALEMRFTSAWESLSSTIREVEQASTPEGGGLEEVSSADLASILSDMANQIRGLGSRIDDLDDRLLLHGSNPGRVYDSKLDDAKGHLRSAERLLGTEDPSPSDLDKARELADSAKGILKRVLTEYELAEDAQDRAQRLAGRARAIIARCSR